MASAPIPSHEMPPSPGPEVVTGLKPLPKSQLDKNTTQSHQILLDGEKTVRAQDEASIKSQLTSVPEDVKKTEIAKQIITEEESLDESMRRLNVLIKASGGTLSEHQIIEVDEIYNPALVENLDYTIAATESQIIQGKAEHQDLHNTAVETRSQLENTTEVTITYDDKSSNTYTLASWNKKVRDEAVKVWKKEINPAAGDSDFDKADPLTQFAYTLKAKKQILGEKAGGKIQVKFIHEGGKPVDKPAANPESIEALETSDGMRDTTVEVAELLLQTDNAIYAVYKVENGKIVGVKPEELGKLPPHAPLARLAILIGTYNDLPPTSQPQKDNLAAVMYQEIRSLTGSMTMSPQDESLRKRLDLIKNGEGIKSFNIRLEGIKERILNEWLIPAGIDPRTVNKHSLQFARDMILAHAIEGQIPTDSPRQKAELPEAVTNIINGWKEPEASPAERDIILKLAQKGNASSFLTGVLGFNLDNLKATNVGGYAQKTVDAVVARRQTLNRPLTDEEKNSYLEVFQQILGEKNLTEIAKKLGFPPGMGMGVLILALFLPMIQGVLDIGGGEEKK